MVNVKNGQIITVDVLFDGAGASKFPQANAYDAAGSTITGSPFNLTSVVGDLYRTAFTMPGTSKVTVVTTLYDDSGHLTPTAGYSSALDEFVTQNDSTVAEIKITDDAVGYASETGLAYGIVNETTTAIGITNDS